MTLSTQDALIYTMVIAASSDAAVADSELKRIEALVARLPVFEGFDRSRLAGVARDCIDLVKDSHSFDKVLDMVIAGVPDRLHDTAYALAVEVTAVDLKLEQEELRLLEMIRDRLGVDRLTTAAIEAGARALHRRV